jgi:hypothetical protein
LDEDLYFVVHSPITPEICVELTSQICDDDTAPSEYSNEAEEDSSEGEPEVGEVAWQITVHRDCQFG